MTYTTYTNVGPFADNNPPGIDHNFLNGLETMLSALWSDSQITSDHAGGLTIVKLICGLLSLTPTSQVFNGSTSGTMTVEEYGTGSGLKVAALIFNNYKNAGSAHVFTLNTSFAGPVGLFNGGGPLFNLQNGSGNVNVQIVTGLGASAGTSTANTGIGSASFGWYQGSTIVGIQEPGGNSSAHSGIGLIIGK